MSVTIYAEGGFDNASLTKLRRAFGTFFGKLMPDKDQVKVIPCGGRSETYRDFCKAIKQQQVGQHVFLLVDAEAPIAADSTAWDHLKNRPGDKWDRPEGTWDDQVLLMVQCMEAWFLADRDAVRAWYDDPKFDLAKLPPLVDVGKDKSIEPTSKDRIEAGLKAATEDTQKTAYHKTRHGPALLEAIDPRRVVAASAHAERMEASLRARSRARREG